MKNLILVSGDIIKNANNYNVEAIVNPTNEYMETGGGVCGAIYESAGVEQNERNTSIKKIEVKQIGRFFSKFFSSSFK